MKIEQTGNSCTHYKYSMHKVCYKYSWPIIRTCKTQTEARKFMIDQWTMNMMSSSYDNCPTDINTLQWPWHTTNIDNLMFEV